MKKPIIIKNKSNRLFFYSILTALFCALLWMVAKPHFGVRYNYDPGDIVQEDIVSTRNITYINSRETERRVEEVTQRTSPIFDLNISMKEDFKEELNGFFSIFEGKDYSKTDIRELYAQIETDLDENVFEYLVTNNERVDFKNKITAVIDAVADRGYAHLRREDLNKYEGRGVVLKKIKETEITQEKVGVDSVIGGDELMDEISAYVDENYPDLDRRDREVLGEIAAYFMEYNLFYNADESRKQLEVELAKVEPVLNTIKKGAVVIRRGEEINEENYPKLRAITLYTSQFNLKAIIGIGLLLLILIFISVVLFMEEGSKREVRKYLVFALFILFSVFYAYLITFIKNRPHNIIFGVLIPVSGIIMTAEILFKRKFSLTLAIILPILLLLISGNDPHTFLFGMGSGLIALFAVRETEKRSDLLRSSIYIVIANELILTAVALLKELPLRQFSILLIWGAGNGIVSMVLTLGITPFFEVLFNIPTNFRLLELSDLNTPIMKKMQIEAPGTYHHSINVANMAENAARAIKANGLLVRVAALYHDIGKIPNAQYFIENSPGPNKHDLIKPSLSNSILKAHVKMGIEMARKIKLPNEVINIIAQHHGTSLMKYFYHQAVKNNPDGSQIDKKDYHYMGPKPQNREAAIVMLADTAEAASRVLKNPSASRIEEFVNEVVESKFRDGQLNESTLTLRGLMKISIAFKRYLMGVFHSRIEYPDEKEMAKAGK